MRRRYRILFIKGTDKVREIAMHPYQVSGGWIHERHFFNPPDPKNCTTAIRGFSLAHPSTLGYA